MHISSSSTAFQGVADLSHAAGSQDLLIPPRQDSEPARHAGRGNGLLGANESSIFSQSRHAPGTDWQKHLFVVPFNTSQGETIKVVGCYMKGDRLRFEVKNQDGETCGIIKRTQLANGEPVWMLPEHASLVGGADHRAQRSVTATATESVARAAALLRSRLSDIRMDGRLSQIIGRFHSGATPSIAWLNPGNRDAAIANLEAGLRAWNPDFEPKTESDGEDDESVSRINPNDPRHRLQRTFDIADVMRGEDPESAYFACCQIGGQVVGLISIEPGDPPHVGDLLTHPGTSGVGKNLLRIASEYSRDSGGNGVFQLDAGDESARARYESMGLQLAGDRFLMRYAP